MQDFVFIPSPRASVFAFASRPENMPLWNPAVVQSRALGALKVGTRIVQTIKLCGRKFETVFEVTAFDPGRRIAVGSTSGPMSISATMDFRTCRGGTLVTWTVTGDCHGFIRVADALVLEIGRREIRRCLESLKQRLAGPQAPCPRPEREHRTRTAPRAHPSASRLALAR